MRLLLRRGKDKVKAGRMMSPGPNLTYPFMRASIYPSIHPSVCAMRMYVCIPHLQGGKDAASPRYIYTRLHRLARVIFPEVDDSQLEYLNEDGQVIEPKW